ncbi:MAG: TIGR02757 family protein [Rhodothermales bacterium]
MPETLPPPDLPAVRAWLDPIVVRFEQASFIQDDPVSVPHAFDDPRDQELIGLLAALLAWGRRDIMLAKLNDLCERMDFRPAQFIRDLRPTSRALDGFVHRTFNPDDAMGLCLSLQSALREHRTLENLFRTGMDVLDDGSGPKDLTPALSAFSHALFDGVPGRPKRMRKHLARPETGSACKRLVMFLRWMVRSGPVDLGIWSTLSPADLWLPLDVHSGRQAREAGLLARKQNDWRSVQELTAICRQLRPEDPAAYDFAFFGVGSSGESLSWSRVSAT